MNKNKTRKSPRFTKLRKSHDQSHFHDLTHSPVDDTQDRPRSAPDPEGSPDASYSDPLHGSNYLSWDPVPYRHDSEGICANVPETPPRPQVVSFQSNPIYRLPFSQIPPGWEVWRDGMSFGIEPGSLVFSDGSLYGPQVS